MLTLLLLLLVIMINNEHNVSSFLSLFFGFTILCMLILLLVGNFPTLIIALLTYTIIDCVGLFCVGNIGIGAGTTFVTAVIAAFFLLLLAVIIRQFTVVRNFNPRRIRRCAALSFFIGISFIRVKVYAVVAKAVTTVASATVSVSSSLCRIRAYGPRLKRGRLFHSKVAVKGSVVKAAAGALCFSFINDCLTLFL